MSRRVMFRYVGLFLLLVIIGTAIFAYVRYFRFINVSAIRSEATETNVLLPAQFESTVFASGLETPRFMGVDDSGVLHVADRRASAIIALPDENGDGVADEHVVVASDLGLPHSITWHEGAWYVGVPSGVIRLIDEDGDLVADVQEVVVDGITTDGSHTTRTVDFLPDGRMVLSVGSTCNVCDEEDERRATILIYDDKEGNGERILATGLRNAVGLDVYPETGELWASNNGRDLMGDDEPPETIHIIEDGLDYGWPTCHSGRIIDPDMGSPGDCEGVETPIVEMQAHSAPLGITFYDGDQFPTEYQGDLFIAFHGSWNRSVPTGYKVVRLDFDEAGNPASAVEDFATGWLNDEDGSSSGRPTGVTVGGDGALYVTDDKGGFIYRIAYAE
ncbi:MAG: PQQ-dependent sugar dehydrogenase [Chloroflexota bacterium]